MRPPIKPGKGMHDKKVMSFVDSYWKACFRPPSIREISEACGISSTSVTAYTLRRLARDGRYIILEGRNARRFIPVWVKKAIQKGVTNGKRRIS